MNAKETNKFLKKEIKKGKKFIIFHDTETTGILKTDRILQSAHALYEVIDKNIKFIDYLEENIMPPVPIGPASAAVHGIWYPDLEGCPNFAESESKKYFDIFIENKVFYSAHNSDFDIFQLEKEGVLYPKELVIDTLQIARLVNVDTEEIESNGLQYLRYFYNFDMQPEFSTFISDYNITKLQPHTALSDIAVLAYYFRFLLLENHVKSLEDGVEMTNTYLISNKVTFGNVFEKDTKISEAITSTYRQYNKTKRGIDYFNWAMLNMTNLSPDMKISISKHVIEAVKDTKLHINDDAITPMKYIAATFLPEYNNFLNKNGFDVESAKSSTIKKIQKEMKKIEEAGTEDERSSGYYNMKKMISSIS